MITVLLFLGLTIGGIVWLIIWENDEKYHETEFLAIVTVVLGIVFIGSLFAIPISIIDINADIEKFYATENSLAIARANSNISDLELAAIQQKVIEMNKWLATAQYWKKHPISNWFWPKKVLELAPIK